MLGNTTLVDALFGEAIVAAGPAVCVHVKVVLAGADEAVPDNVIVSRSQLS
jgi:hypothetical protein